MLTKEQVKEMVDTAFGAWESEYDIGDDWSKQHEARDIALEALEQMFCKNEEYEKDLDEMKEQILKEGDTLLTKRDLLERFCEIDKEYNGRPWNLLQILSNINILIGEKPCEDAINREDVIKAVDHHTFDTDDGLCLDEDISIILEELPPVTLKPKVGHWIVEKCGNIGHCSNCENFYTNDWYEMNYCPNCSARMIGSKKSEETK